ncbi:AAA family ATPase [Rhodohalobacter mucosus]|nr:AAA family ATPase [Rhodohalobacter mucosus]
MEESKRNFVKDGDKYIYVGEIETTNLPPGIYVPFVSDNGFTLEDTYLGERDRSLYRHEENTKNAKFIGYHLRNSDKFKINKAVNIQIPNKQILPLENYSPNFKAISERIEVFLKKINSDKTNNQFKEDKYLIAGEPGTGKSEFVKRECKKMVLLYDARVILIHNQDDLRAMYSAHGFSTIEKSFKDELIVYVFEEFDSLIESFGENIFKELLDSKVRNRKQITFMITNYPDKLPVAITRKGRIDYIEMIGPKSFSINFIYDLYETLIGEQLPKKHRNSDWLEEVKNRLTPAEIVNLIKESYFYNEDIDETWRRRKVKTEEEEIILKRNGVTGF